MRDHDTRYEMRAAAIGPSLIRPIFNENSNDEIKWIKSDNDFVNKYIIRDNNIVIISYDERSHIKKYENIV